MNRKIWVGTCPVLFPSWHVGDRVQRPMDVYKKSPIRHGEVVLRYSITDNRGLDYSQDYPELYAVRWDDGKVEKGFLRHGLMFEKERV